MESVNKAITIMRPPYHVPGFQTPTALCANRTAHAGTVSVIQVSTVILRPIYVLLIGLISSEDALNVREIVLNRRDAGMADVIRKRCMTRALFALMIVAAIIGVWNILVLVT
jgi:hypothetical protein